IAITEKSKNPDIAWKFIKFLAMEKNEITQEMLQNYDSSLSNPIIQFKKDDPYYKVKIESLKYITENIGKINSLQIEIWNMFSAGLREIVKSSTDIQKDLSILAIKMDNEKTKYSTGP
ncbi:MAG: hypothetical protein K0Q73_9197, partial [Paenibacillus sp.]|nr:hypothetical protein [Paenibacillus sp.]